MRTPARRSMRGRSFAIATAALVLVLLALPSPRAAVAATLPAGFTETTIASAMSSPTAMAIAPDGRIFVAEQTGSLRVIKNDALLPTPFVSLTVDSSGERGMLGVAFDPNFASNHFVYIYYTTPSPSVHNRLSRFTANGDVAVVGSELVLLDLNNLSGATNHNGGAIHFGPDGKLYVAVGENANGANAQTLTNLLGKILRINSDGTIPSDNPFFGAATGINRLIWAMGVRNPFTFAFQPGTGRMFINDVGQSTWEEIDDGIAGSNYGWPNTEGTTSDPAFRSPLFVYGHGSSSTTGCAITGGAFYNPATQQFPASYAGKYFFSDYCTGWIRLFDPGTGTASGFATGIGAPVDLQVSPDGSLYYLYRGSGAVNRIRYTASNAPAITQQPANITVTAGSTASFGVSASGAAPLSFQWQRNNVNIAGATSSSYTTPATVIGDNGATYRSVVSNGFGTATSNAATLTVTPNVAPTGTITLPASGTTYAGGDTINYAGAGTDPEDGTLPASAFTWQVDFRHDTHAHPFVPATSGSKTGSFVIPTSGETSASVWYRIILVVRDSGGMTNTTFLDVMPRKSTITLASVRSGLQLTMDGQPVTAPNSVQGVAGIVRAIGATSPQTLTGTPWTFTSWSDGGAATHNITTPATNTTYTATFTPQIAVPPNESVVPIPTAGAGSADGIAPIAPPPQTTDAALPPGEPPRSPIEFPAYGKDGGTYGPPLPRTSMRALAPRIAELILLWRW
jgi:glucose/arabinose dehydrogenase